MTLRGSLRASRTAQLKTAAKWADFPAPFHIERAASLVEIRAAGLRPATISQQDLQRLKQRLLAASEGGSFDTVKKRDWRYTPWVFWYGDDQVALSRNIVLAFLQRAADRKSPTWIKALINAYLTRFPAESSSLPPISKAIQQLISSNRWPSLAPWAERHRRWKLFDVADGPTGVASHILGAETVKDGLKEIGLDSSIAQSADFSFLKAAYFSSLSVASENLRLGNGSAERTIRRLIEWSLPLAPQQGGLRYPQLISQIAATMLLPWKTRSPDALTKELIQRFLIQQIGDPRVKPGAWQSIDAAAKDIMLRWLAGETLAHFFNLLSRTADDIWEYRKKFWTAYYQQGAISEAWFALGPIAQTLGRQQKLQFGDLSRAAQNQSVLIMKLGNFIVAEWSHSGACRFWNEYDRLAPALYRKVYFADDLRNPCSFDQAHHASDYGTWQRKISTYIRRETGIAVSESDWR